MSETFQITFVKGHPAINVDGNIFIVDTGSPATFGRQETITLCGRDFNADMENNVFGVNMEEISKLLGTHIDGFIGGDTFRQLAALEFDYPNNTITFHDVLPDMVHGSQTDFEMCRNYVSINLLINGQTHRVFFDCGAPIAYLNPEILPNRKPDGVRNDVSPFGGAFESPVFLMETQFAGRTFESVYGPIPETHRTLVIGFGHDGIVGKNILDLGKVFLCYEQQKMYLL